MGHGKKKTYDDRIYILGGRNNVHNPATMVRYYSVTRDHWERVSDMHEARSHLGCAAATRRHRSKIYAVAGGNSPLGVSMTSVEVYDVKKDSWKLHEDLLPDGRTRVAVENINDKLLMVIGGDSTCAGGGGANCAPDQPLTAVDLIDIRRRPRLLSRDKLEVPQLLYPRQTPATATRADEHSFELYVVGGRTRDENGQGVLTTTERLVVHPDAHECH